MEKKEISGKVKINNASFNGIVNAASVDLKSSIVNNDNINACIAERGVAGFSPVANVIKNGDDVTITITDYKGTTTATIPDMSDEVERIEALIPSTASTTNKLVDSATLNSSVQTATSNFRGDWATYADIPTDASLYPVDAAGVRTPSTNDYLVVMTDEEKNGGTWRYKYVGLWSVDGKNGWQAEYQVNETPFTADQLAAINSGITSELVEEIGGGGGGLEIGDVGFTQMAIDESKGKRRILNGQLIIQEQYAQFANIVKNSVALNPDLACTEAEWQTELTMSANGVCYKYVIDDEAGTIRLPKYPEYLDLSINGAKAVSVYGTGMTLGLTNGSGTNVGIAVNNGNVGYLRQDNYGKTLPYTNTGTAGLSTGAAVGVTKDASKSGITGSVTTTSEQIKGTYFIQVATGAETEDNITNELELLNPYSLLDYKWSEYELNNSSWLRSEGQYNYKSTHPVVYDLLLKIYNGTETKAGVSVKLTSETFTDYDFVLNTADETFRLPIKVKQKFFTGGDVPVVGTGKCLGLNDGTDNFGFAATTATQEFRGSVGLYGANVGTSAPAWLNGKNVGIGVTSDSSKSGLVAKLSSTEVSGLYLYFYVGAVAQNAPIVNLGRIQETYTTKSMVDGQWVGTGQVRFYDGAMSVGTLSFDLSDYLPNDGYCYEVIVNLNFKGGSTTSALHIGSGLISSIDMAQTENSSDFGRSNAIIPIGTDRVLKMILAGANATDVNLLLVGYRRIGTNL